MSFFKSYTRREIRINEKYCNTNSKNGEKKMIIVTTVDYFDSKAEKANRNELRFCIDDTEESAKCIAAVQKNRDYS